MLTVNALQTMTEALDEIDESFITKMVIYRELREYLSATEIEEVIDDIYELWLKNEIWIDLGTFSMNVGRQYHAYAVDDLLKTLVQDQGELE